MPFGGENWAERVCNIARARYDFTEDAFRQVSEVAKDFVSHLLVRRPDRRMSAAQALQHKWMFQGNKDKKQRCMTIMRLNLKTYLSNYRTRWQVILLLCNIIKHRVLLLKSGQIQRHIILRVPTYTYESPRYYDLASQ